jgi:lipid-A-disaccharide synthase
MSPDLRSSLYFLGLIGNLCFALRVIIQWVASERKKENAASKTFWLFSLVGNIIMLTHYGIQLMFPYCLVQTINAAIACRNLNLLKKSKAASLSKTLVLFSFFILSILTIYILQSLQTFNEIIWMHSPFLSWQTTEPSFIWNLIGSIGTTMFASRFIIQWRDAELHKKSELKNFFWLLSIIGALCSLIYGIYLLDPVIIIGHSFALIPYVRNIILNKQK